MKDFFKSIRTGNKIYTGVCRKILFNALAVVMLVTVFAPIFINSVQAATQVGETKTSKTMLVSPLNTEVKDVRALLIRILDQIVIKIGSVVAVCFLIWSGYKFVAARGNPTKIEEARSIFMWTLAGIAILLGAKAIALIVTNTIESISGTKIPSL